MTNKPDRTVTVRTDTARTATAGSRTAALAFRALHVPGHPLVLPNAWDTVSALLVEQAGARAVATTSGGVAWDLGTADGDRLDRTRAVGAVGRIAAAVRVPVTADIETGYADDARGVGDTVRAVLAAGAVGVNIEDALPGGGALRPVAEQAERIAAARAAADTAGVPLFVNARIDTCLSGTGGVAETAERAAAFLAAGADGVFVPGAVDPGDIKALCDGVDGPLNVMVDHSTELSVAELAALGVARVSTGTGLAQAAHAAVRRAARELLDTGTYRAPAGAIDYGELNALLDGGR
ncbi:isocitrate lyase/phosphoenolpyruvate mutase family protein [Streptomyces sp. NPDC059785]|uniref:isocitrate lyase/PEP mutase family protein n=1 Tax=Streptomyces sp. NPDC059785 TaxID=3346945 RepID=UPI0036605533